MSRGGAPRSPLPQRQGVDAVRLRLPQDGPWASLREHLVARLRPVDVEEVDAMLRDGRVVDRAGVPLPPHAPFVGGSVVWTRRELRPEVEVPFAIEVLHRDERLVVLDKPHFLATMPRGRHIVQSALARARHELELPDLAPAHRLDRLTAGVLVLTTQQRWRGAYQGLFAARAVRKGYLAVAAVRDGLALPATVRNHLAKARGQLQSAPLPGRSVNAETHVELVERRGDLGLYRLAPTTGRTHQLRRHLSDLGIPILGDPLYPVAREVAADDFRDPLQLLAASLEFVDPVDGRARSFTSRRRLSGWPQG